MDQLTYGAKSGAFFRTEGWTRMVLRAPLKILVVDDFTQVRELIVTVLKAGGFSVK